MVCCFIFFFFKQKTAYEMRISDWSSDVCSSDLLERERTASEQAGARKAMVGSGDRSERIRTYNFPQGRVTDHRINLTLHRLPEILEGPGLQEIISALTAEDEASRLAQLDNAGG